MKAEELEDRERSALDRALEDLLVGETRVKVDPATAQIIQPDGEKSPLTEAPDTNTLP